MSTATTGYKHEFIEFMLASNVLTFGDFTTKSGRKTPYFINSGRYDNGEQILRLGEFYAAALMERLNGEFDNLYGPAYKGIPLVVTTAAALHRLYGKTVTFTFNRKEAKDHGERGVLVGHQYRGTERVVIVEDVVTAGTSVNESVPVLKSAADGVKLAAVIVSVDRQERGASVHSALDEISQRHHTDAFAIVTLDEIVDSLRHREIDGRVILDDDMLTKIAAYREQYGIRTDK